MLEQRGGESRGTNVSGSVFPFPDPRVSRRSFLEIISNCRVSEIVIYNFIVPQEVSESRTDESNSIKFDFRIDSYYRKRYATFSGDRYNPGINADVMGNVASKKEEYKSFSFFLLYYLN